MGVAMAQPYSADVRERVVLACEHREGRRAVMAQRFRVSVSTVDTWWQHARSDGRRQAKPHAGGPAPTLDGHHRAVLRALVAEDNDATVAESGRRLVERTGGHVRETTLCDGLNKMGLKMGLVRKKRLSGPPRRHETRSRPRGTLFARRSLVSRAIVLSFLRKAD